MPDNDIPQNPPDPDRLGFTFDIAMALRGVALYRGRGQKLSLDDKMALAAAILNHLRISGVVLSRKPPLEGHGRRGPQRDPG